ncbi:mRNA export factor Gle1 isoform X2 [Neocloeon triangulifer]|uniref:mRNA export factor Gle1 isoform X2 n=1 Tax=Neocloeon triangulifer TaxID=2078957 RepID=UPI00286F848F|nr:mRNA export factor Gle1 isoform X2 [Neocloeon triangulifer]
MMDELETPGRRITRSMTMKAGSAVCEEIKLSALLKATKICEAKRAEETLALELKVEEEYVIKTSSSILVESLSSSKLDDKFEGVTSLKNADADDADSVQRRILENMELERLRDVEDAVLNRVAKLRAYSIAIRATLEERAKQREKERREEEAALQNESEGLENLERNRTALVLQLQSKKNVEQEKKIEKIIDDASKFDLRKREELKAKRELLEKIVSNQHKFREKYQQLSDVLKDEIISGGTITQEVAAIKNLTGMMETLSKQCKVGEVSNLDLTTSEALVQSLEAGFSAINGKLEGIKKVKEEANRPVIAEVKAEPATPPAYEPVQAAQPPENVVRPLQREIVAPTPKALEPTQEKPTVTGLEGFISRENLAELTRLQAFLEQRLNLVKPFETDQSMKKLRFQLQKSVNTPLNAISAVSNSHLKDKLQRLQAVLRGQTVEVTGTVISANSHPQGIAYCTNLLAERIVEQGEQIVSSKPDSAFAIAAVALTIWSEFPEFGDLLLAHFYTKCPFLVPYYSPRPAGSSDENYYKSLGYKYDEDGKIEPQDKYLKRMTGTAHLFFAILISKLPRDISSQPPPTLAKIWTWLASLLNLDPRPDISATILLTCLEVAGHLLCSTYQKQFHKMFIVIVNNYFPLIQQLSPNVASGPISRLEMFLSKACKGFIFPPPTGALPQHFW